jgi:hypothetical protein
VAGGVVILRSGKNAREAISAVKEKLAGRLLCSDASFSLTAEIASRAFLPERRITTPPATLDDFKNIVLKTGDNGVPVYLGDVARVQVGPEMRPSPFSSAIPRRISGPTCTRATSPRYTGTPLSPVFSRAGVSRRRRAGTGRPGDAPRYRRTERRRRSGRRGRLSMARSISWLRS